MESDDQPLERLRAALGPLSAQEAAELLAEARMQARERVRRVLADAMVESMLDGVRRQLEPPAPRSPQRAPADPAPAPPPPAAPAARSTVKLGSYVYGVIGAEASPGWTLPGIDPAHAVTTVREGRLAAVVSRVALEDFGEARLREHLGDMGWVEATARAHEGVLEQTRAQVTVIPMRMCTVYRREDAVREMLRRESATLGEALGYLEGKTEMGVKAFATGARRTEPEPAAEPRPDGPRAGAAYMQRRQRERDLAEESAQRLEEAREEIHTRLSALAYDGLLVPPQRPEATGRQEDMILNGVYLVEDDALEQFRREVAELEETFAAAGLELELTGPWPAYNFVPGTMGVAW